MFCLCIRSIGRQHFGVLSSRYHSLTSLAPHLEEPLASRALALPAARALQDECLAEMRAIVDDSDRRGRLVADLANSLCQTHDANCARALQTELGKLSSATSRLDVCYNTILGELKRMETLFGAADARRLALIAASEALIAFQSDFVAKVVLLTNLESQYDDHLERTLDAAGHMRKLVETYRGYMAAYEPMRVELARRQAVHDELVQYVQSVTQELARRHAAELSARQRFAEVYADFLPHSLCPDLALQPQTYRLVPASASTSGGGTGTSFAGSGTSRSLAGAPGVMPNLM